MTTNIRFEDWKTEKMKDPDFQEAVRELEPAYQVTRLRIRKGLTQADLADLVGTKQSSIARLESGSSQPSLTFLRRVVKALGGVVEIKIYTEDEFEPEIKTVKTQVRFIGIRPIVIYRVGVTSDSSFGGKFSPRSKEIVYD